MKRSVLVIDDEKDQAVNLSKALGKKITNTDFSFVHEEKDILESIEEQYFSIAIVDLRMDKYEFDGVQLIKNIFKRNPFAKVIIVSAFKGEYLSQLKDLLLTGKVIDIIEKTEFNLFVEKLTNSINNYHDNIFTNPSEINSALLEFYSQAKNETDGYKKGERFEHFVSLLFQSIGFNSINKRVIDKSSNEVDLIIRNEIDDSFFK